MDYTLIRVGADFGSPMADIIRRRVELQYIANGYLTKIRRIIQ